jgi:hypothetical protein
VAATDSALGTVAVTLTSPAQRADSALGTVAVSLAIPHLPIVVRTASGYRSVGILSHDGTRWR